MNYLYNVTMLIGCFLYMLLSFLAVSLLGEDVVLLSNEEVIFIGSATRKGSIVCL